jgi:hypothetical protein
LADCAVRTQQFYFPGSAVLATRFVTEDGVADVHDFTPILAADDADHRQRLFRDRALSGAEHVESETMP